jgi:hypothetical protein
MKSIDTLEEQFKTQLVAALRRAARGRSSTIFSLKENRARSSAHKLQAKALRIMDLRQMYSVDRSAQSPAASYLAACLRWEHGAVAGKRSARDIAENLLHHLQRERQE